MPEMRWSLNTFREYLQKKRLRGLDRSIDGKIKSGKKVSTGFGISQNVVLKQIEKLEQL
jgi:biotin operon repressor